MMQVGEFFISIIKSPLRSRERFGDIITELALNDVDRSTHIPLEINGNMKKINFPKKWRNVQVNSRKKKANTPRREEISR